MTAFRKIAILFALLPLLFSCSREDLAPEQSDRLYIRAATHPFSDDSRPQTKAVNNGYLTTFESGDVIGVTGIDKYGNILSVCNNVRFEYQKDTVENGAIWSSFVNERGYNFVERVDGATYFAYYPYDEKWNGCKLDSILVNFTLLEDQSTKEKFDSCDLIASEGSVAPLAGVLRFEMSHKMATVSIFYNNEFQPDGVTPRYPLILESGTTPASLTLAHTYRARTEEGEKGHLELRHRYLVKPQTKVKLVGRLEESNVRMFSYSFDVEAGHLYSISFEGEPLVPYTDGVDLELNDVEFVDRDGNTVTLGHTVMWSKYNLGESLGESYPFAPASSDRGGKSGTRDPFARGDYYCWGATFTQYDNGLTGYKGYGFNNYFDPKYEIAPLGGTIKETEYDVAHAKWWRGKWRLPTENEFRAMYAGCTFKLETTYSETQQRYMGEPVGKQTYNVIKVTSKNNPEKFIYMSTGGYSDGTMLPEKDAEGNLTDSGDGKKNAGIIYQGTAYYLSSSASPTILRCISYAYFNDKSQLIKVDGSRYTGMLVRPVYSPDE
ncbi:MAG: fimbrillin family protein [Candidatus Cryptobacteroides sp.]|nr:fimbrillin family protein [Candidatus Cryptobacteroides sp.]